MRKIKIGIIGPGAIGGVIGVKLASAGYDVELTKKVENDLVIDNTIGLHISGKFGTISYLVPFVNYNTFSDKKDIIFVCTSAYSMSRCLEDAVTQLKPNGIIVAIQNVITMDELIDKVPIDNIVMMYIDWSSVRVNPHEMYVFDGGKTHIGAFSKNIDKKVKLVQQVLNNVSPTVIEENFPEFVVSRFILDNTQLCMGALTGRAVGGFLSSKQGKNVFINLIREQVAITKASGMRVVPYDDAFDYEKFVSGGISGILYRKTMFNRLIFRNGHVVSRVLRRLENNKRTEIDWLIKVSVDKAKLHNVSAPYCNATYNLLSEIVDSKRTICMENLLDPQFTSIKE